MFLTTNLLRQQIEGIQAHVLAETKWLKYGGYDQILNTFSLDVFVYFSVYLQQMLTRVLI